MQGAMFVIDQLGQTIMMRDQQIARLTAELEQAQAQLAKEGEVTDEPAQGSGDS